MGLGPKQRSQKKTKILNRSKRVLPSNQVSTNQSNFLILSYHNNNVKDQENKRPDNQCWKECGENRTLIHCQQDCKIVPPLRKSVRRILIKLKINLSCGLDLLLFGICLNDWTWYFIETFQSHSMLLHLQWLRNGNNIHVVQLMNG